jgi:hypothetical protein
MRTFGKTRQTASLPYIFRGAFIRAIALYSGFQMNEKVTVTERIRKMLKKFIFSLTGIMALSLVVMAQGDKTTLEGYMVDKACATGTGKVAKAADPQAAAANEPKSCVLMDGCMKSGLGIYSGGKYTEFDKKGIALAKAALEKSKKDKGAKFKVTGKVTGDKMAVEKVEEVK